MVGGEQGKKEEKRIEKRKNTRVGGNLVAMDDGTLA